MHRKNIWVCLKIRSQHLKHHKICLCDFFLQLNVSFKTYHLGQLFFWDTNSLQTSNGILGGRILGHQLESWYNRITEYMMSEGKGFFVGSWNPNVSRNNVLHLRDKKCPNLVSVVETTFGVFGFKRCNFSYKNNYSNVNLLMNLFPLNLEIW